MQSDSTYIASGLRRRDPGLLDHLIERYQHRLLRYLLYLTGNRERAQDLFQETWVRVLERGHQYNGKHEFSSWLYAVARNLMVDAVRKDHAGHQTPISLDALVDDNDRAQWEPSDDQPSAWERVARQQESERLQTALLNLPTEYREVIVLRFYDGLALDEIARVTASPVGTVKSRLYRALEKLARHWEGGNSNEHQST